MLCIAGDVGSSLFCARVFTAHVPEAGVGRVLRSRGASSAVHVSDAGKGLRNQPLTARRRVGAERSAHPALGSAKAAQRTASHSRTAGVAGVDWPARGGRASHAGGRHVSEGVPPCHDGGALPPTHHHHHRPALIACRCSRPCLLSVAQVHVEEGALICPESGRRFPINKGIPNMLLDEDQTPNNND